MRSLTWEWGVFGDAGLYWQAGLFRQALHGYSEHHGGYNSGRLPPHQETRELAADFQHPTATPWSRGRQRRRPVALLGG